jgi:hypothetical protein
MARGVSSLENCAVLLEAAHLQGAAVVNGAYQGYFIFVDAQHVSSGAQAEGYHYPVLLPPQRAEVDRDLRELMKERGGKLPNASDLSLERK